MARQTKEQKLKAALELMTRRAELAERQLAKLEPIADFRDWVVAEIEGAVINGRY